MKKKLAEVRCNPEICLSADSIYKCFNHLQIDSHFDDTHNDILHTIEILIMSFAEFNSKMNEYSEKFMMKLISHKNDAMTPRNAVKKAILGSDVIKEKSVVY